jgi:histidinol-phosphate aminotransferase
MSYRYSAYIEKYNDSIKLDLNEFNFEHDISMTNEILKAINLQKTITHYSNMCYDTTYNLINNIAKYNNINNDNILLTAGSDVGLEYLVNYLVKENTTVYVFVPTYSYFVYLSKNKTKNIIYIPFIVTDYDYNIENYINKYVTNDINDNNVVIYIVNPNNPTGILFNRNYFDTILTKYSKFKFIVDEAYIEYCSNQTCVDYIKNHSNLFITRTFSKAYGLAGLRIGYIISNNNNILELHKYFNESSLTEISKIAANFIYEHIDYYENIINRVNQIRTNFEYFLDENNISYIKTSAGFISIYIGNTDNNKFKYINCEKFIDILKSHNIFIRSKNEDINMKGYVRITFGPEHIMNRIKEIILNIIN